MSGPYTRHTSLTPKTTEVIHEGCSILIHFVALGKRVARRESKVSPKNQDVKEG
jgi:hypothetical protein